MEFEHKRQNLSEENEMIKNIIRFDKNYKFLNSNTAGDETQQLNNIFELIENKRMYGLAKRS